MPSTSLSQVIAFPASLLLGGWLALISYSNLASAKTVSSNHLLIAPVQNSGVLYAQQSLPQLQPASPSSVIEFRQQPQPSYKPLYKRAPSYQNNYQNYDRHYHQYYYNQYYTQPYNQSVERYLVYVDSSSEELLQQVRLIEPRAYIRRFQGRYVIQAGAFSREYNAQQRVRQLQSYGIYHAQLVSYGNREESFARPYQDSAYRQRSFYPPDREYREDRPYYPREYRDDYHSYRGKFYYVAIPAPSEELPNIESRIRQSLGRNIRVIARNHPRGPHLAVGPFVQQSEAEQWNNYLHSMGFGNARVYYGS